jgi:pimeloyl-ACP methyl ester carboxylesterase
VPWTIAGVTVVTRGARVETWDETGHMLHLVNPDQFVARVRPLLANTPAPERSV